MLDLGCGEGELLALLGQERGVKGVGIELSEDAVTPAVRRGLSVHHGDIEEGLDHYADASFDLVILSLTIQEIKDIVLVIDEAFRVGRRVIVVFSNFGFWRVRWQLAAMGRAPQTRSFPHSWFNSPNQHFFTMADWEAFCSERGIRRVARSFLTVGKTVRWLPNLRAEVAMYLMEKP